MSNVVGVINYGIAGNIHSIKKAVEKAGGIVKVINNKEEFKEVSKIVIPGVGSFNDAMRELESDDLLNSLKEEIKIKPTLGVCLGMQILATIGFEYGKSNGLAAINAEVKPMLVDAKIPHMGFNRLNVINPNKLLNNIEEKEFYFMHSYEMINYTNIISLTDYCGHQFVSSIQKNNLYGVQFHPEKSREAGIELFKNFLEL